MTQYEVVGYNWKMIVDVDEELFEDGFMEASTRATEQAFDINGRVQTDDHNPASLGTKIRVYKLEKTGAYSESKTFSSESVLLNASLWTCAELIKNAAKQNK